jgi:hypothetical protein
MVGCVVEPLPSPIAPDGTKIVLSSLTADSDESTEGSVAILGLPDAVNGYGTVRIVNERDMRTEFIQSTVEGSFVGTLLAKGGDVLIVSYLVESFESRTIEITVPQYTTEKEQDGQLAGAGPRQPNDDFDEAVQDPAPETNGEPPPVPPVADAAESLFELLGDGLVRVQSGPDFIGPNHTLFVGNLVTGETFATVADAEGAVDITFPAEPGDRILMFSASPDDPAQTSPVTEYQIPFE